jgi:voltage-gated potassium channel
MTMLSSPIYNIALSVLSSLALALLGIDLFFDYGQEVSKLIQFYDFILCGVFFADFLLNLKASKDWKKYLLTTGWIDLLSSIPMVDYLRLGRISKIFKLLRLVRISKGYFLVFTSFRENKKKSTFLLASSLSSVILCLCSILILLVETSSDSNIKSAENAIWWSIATITTVGYGDYYPVTGPGRVIASILMVTGITVFGVITASLSSLFINKDSDASSELSEIKNELAELKLILLEKRQDDQSKDDAA